MALGDCRIALVARYIRIVEARGSNPLSSTTICLKTTVFRLFIVHFYMKCLKKQKEGAFHSLFFRFLALKCATRAPAPNRLMARRRL